MSASPFLPALPEMQIVGWTVLHALWQGAVLGVLLLSLLVATRGRSARLRYALASATLVAMMVAPLATASRTRAAWSEHEWCWREAGAGTRPLPTDCRDHGLMATEQHAAEASDDPRHPMRVHALSLRVNRATGWIGAAWLLGTLLLLVRAAVGWRGALRLQELGTAPASAELERSLRLLARRLGVRRAVSLRTSTRVDVPTLVGWRRPVILLPEGLQERISLPELEAVLAHELAHVRRHDAAVNLVQVVLECLLFAHPAARWAAARVREEREACCDEAAVGALAGRVGVYLRALLTLESLRPAPPRRHVIAITGGPLLARARRLAERTSTTPRRPSAAALAAATALLIAVAQIPSGAHLSAWAIMTMDIQTRGASEPSQAPGR